MRSEPLKPESQRGGVGGGDDDAGGSVMDGKTIAGRASVTYFVEFD